MHGLHNSAAPLLLGLWGGGGAVYLYLFLGAVVGVFAPSFWLADRHPRRGVLLALRVLAIGSAAAAVAGVAWLIGTRAWEAPTVWGGTFVVPVLLGAAAALGRAVQHGRAVAALKPVGDPVLHWSKVLREHPRWWFRSRAARELGALAPRETRARKVLETARRDESNAKVRAAIARSLHALPAAPGR